MLDNNGESIQSCLTLRSIFHYCFCFLSFHSNKGRLVQYRLIIILMSMSFKPTFFLRVYKAEIKPVISYARVIRTLTKHNELLLCRFERKNLWRIFGFANDPNTEHHHIRTNAEVQDLNQKPNKVKSIKSQRLRWAGQVQRAPDDQLIKIVREENPAERKRPLGLPRDGGTIF